MSFRALQIALLSALCYSLLIILLAQGLLQPGMADVVTPRIGLDLFNKTFLRLLVFLCFGLASAYVSKVCRYADRRVDRLRKIAGLIFRHVRVGLLLLDGNRMVEVNDRACYLLQRSRESLLGQPIGKVMQDECPKDTIDGRKQRVVCRFQRKDGSSFPAAIEVSRLSVDAEVLPFVLRSGMVEVQILVFSDVTNLLEMQEHVRDAERLRAAAKTTSEIAHEIRNPLAAISGTVQLLQRMEEKSDDGDPRYQLLRGERRSGVYQQVVMASEELDRTIERFINYAESRPETLSRLIGYNDSLREPSSCSYANGENLDRENEQGTISGSNRDEFAGERE